MRYFGGKERVARYLAPIIVEAARGRTIWEPFCGGLSVSAAMARAGATELLLTDANAPLIQLYRAFARGWKPPVTIGREEYERAKTLPDTDPFKAFALIGCAWGGKWCSGFADPDGGKPDTWIRHRTRNDLEPARAAAASLARKFGALRAVPHQFGVVDFQSMPPDPGVSYCVYCDPPYAGTTGYRAPGVPPWDPAAFWARARSWAAAGHTVLVSEYAAPESARATVVWELERNLEIGHGRRRVEKLFLLAGA